MTSRMPFTTSDKSSLRLQSRALQVAYAQQEERNPKIYLNMGDDGSFGIENRELLLRILRDQAYPSCSLVV